MKRRIRKPRKTPAVSTASLPDIIFILLFFFMVVAVIKNQDLLVEVQLPVASELEEIKRSETVNHIYIGYPKISSTKSKLSGPKIQLNDAFAEVDEIGQFVRANPDNALTMLKVDEAATMGLITEVKTALRKANRLKLNYAALQGMKN